MKFTIVVVVAVALFGVLEGKHTGSKHALKKMEKGAKAALNDLKYAEHGLRRLTSENDLHLDTPKVFVALNKAQKELKKVKSEGSKAIKKLQ